MQQINPEKMGWSIKETEKITFFEKEFIFETYMDSIHFVSTIASIAEELDHHPEITIYYKKIRVIIYTHTTNNITDKDLQFIEKLTESAS